MELLAVIVGTMLALVFWVSYINYIAKQWEKEDGEDGTE